jgi:hypothetical protein
MKLMGIRDSTANILLFLLFQTANGGLPGGSGTTTRQYTNTYTTQNNTTKKEKSVHKATQTMKVILQPMDTGTTVKKKK